MAGNDAACRRLQNDGGIDAFAHDGLGLFYHFGSGAFGICNENARLVHVMIGIDNIVAVFGDRFEHVAHIFGADGDFSVAQQQRRLNLKSGGKKRFESRASAAFVQIFHSVDDKGRLNERHARLTFFVNFLRRHIVGVAQIRRIHGQ